MMRPGLLVLVASCTPANEFPPVGNCDPRQKVGEEVIDTIELVGSRAVFHELTSLDFIGGPSMLLAVPEDRGTLFMVDRQSLEVSRIDDLPKGVGSVAFGRSDLYLADDETKSIVVVDYESKTTVSTLMLESRPQHVRYSSPTVELWVTQPDDDRIEVLDIGDDGSLSRDSYVELPDRPVGLAVDRAVDRAYAHLREGKLVVIDVETKAIADVWDTGCGEGHGSPQFDRIAQVVFVACASRGAGVALDQATGAVVAGHEAGEGAGVLAVNGAVQQVYLHGDRSNDLAVLRTCIGAVGLNGVLEIPGEGRAMFAEDRAEGHFVWITDEGTGGLIRLSDPYFE